MAVMWKRELRQGDQLESGNKEEGGAKDGCYRF